MIPLTSSTLFLAQLIAHIAAVYWVLASFSLAGALVVVFVYFLTGCMGMSVTYHRLLTHRSFKTSKTFEYTGTVLATLGLTGSSLSWTASHRQHHRSADRAGDPHSPNVLGYVKAQWGSMFSPIDIRKSPVLSDAFHRWMHKHYFTVNLTYGALCFAVGGIEGVLIAWLVPAVVLWNAGSLINTVCHTRRLGYRRYETGDSSVNNPILGLLMWGEGWHNNHHRHQNRPNIGERWWEIDIGWFLIKLVRK